MVGIGGQQGSDIILCNGGRAVTRSRAFSAAALATLTFFAPASSFAFRSAGDLPDFDSQAHVAFATPNISVELFQDVAPDLDLTLVEADLKQAAETWCAPGCTDVSIAYTGTTDQAAAPGDGHNTIQWVSDWTARGFPKDSPGLTDVQYIKNADGKWTIAEADTYLNLGFDWTTGVPTDDRKSLVAVLTHELGHALGLLHPCELDGSGGAPKCSKSTAYTNEEMYPVYSADQTVLSDDDVAGVCFLYSPSCDDSSCDAGTQCVGGVCQPLCGDAVCQPGTTCEKSHCVATSKDCGSAGCVGQACSSQADCAVKEFCDGHVCARGEGVLGDVCVSAHDCFDGACIDGACAEACTALTPCQSGGSCDNATGACKDSLASMGNKCQFSTDCRGGYCLAEDGKTPLCSRSCESGEPTCPSGWSCRSAEGKRVCAPGTPSDDGCTVSAATPPPTLALPYGLVLSALSMMCWRNLRRRQLRRSRP